MLYKERQKQFGTLVLLGIKSQQLWIMLWIMLSLGTIGIGSFSVVSGVLLGSMILSWGLGPLTESLFGYAVWDFHLSPEALGITPS
ncbi:FtsX-like permease family protein [Pasteuria penetrans]|uniref:FtsX-like permease family protein n=1 Tax=Pasteuria penetrans TaxID=86005 RepID=UPI003CCC5A1D